ncbi:MAG: adenylate kinase [Clostridia bacterium]|nr:adenylate kinase [Clostridia bacterium]
MIIILLGAPGSGKGTQAVMLAEKYSIPHISTGDIFRYNIKNDTPLGKEVKLYIEKGLLVPDQLTCNIVEDRIKQEDCKNGFILDGFPRTIYQAEMLDEMLGKQQRIIDYVLNIAVDDDVVIKRLSGRRMCPNGHIYHIDSNPPEVEGKCNVCQKDLYIRNDDQPETVKERLIAYNNATKPLEEFYERSKRLININGEQTPNQVYVEVLKVI